MENKHYYKYIKYKKKYLELKQSGGMFNKPREWLDTYQQNKKIDKESKDSWDRIDKSIIQQEEDEKQLYGKNLLNIINIEIKKLEDLYNKYKKDNVITIPDIINIKNTILDLLNQIQVKNINGLDNIIEQMTNIYGDEIVNSDNNISYFNNFSVSNKLKDLKNDVKNTLNKYKFPLLTKMFDCFYKFFDLRFVHPINLINIKKQKSLIPQIFTTSEEKKEIKLYGKDLLKIIQEKTKELKNILYLNILEKGEETPYITISEINYVNTIILDLLKQIKEKNIATRLEAEAIKTEFTLIEDKIKDLYSIDIDNISYYNDKDILVDFLSFITKTFNKLESISKFPLLQNIFYYYKRLLGKEFYDPKPLYGTPPKDKPMFQHNIGVSNFSLNRDYYRRPND